MKLARGGNRRGLWELGSLVIAVVIGGVLLVRLADRWGGDDPSVWVSRGDLAAGLEVAREHLAAAEVTEGNVPRGALDAAAIAGRRLTRGKAAGEPFFAADFAPHTPQPRLAALVPPGRVLVTLVIDPWSLPVAQLYRGDRLDVIAVANDGSRVVARDVYFLGHGSSAEGRRGGDGGGLIPPPPESRRSAGDRANLLLAVAPQDVLPLSQVQARGAILRFALQGAEDLAAGRRVTIPAPATGSSRTGRSVELIVGADSSRVAVAH